VAAAIGVPFVPLDVSVPEGDDPAEAVASVEVLDPERSPRYLARVIRGMSIGPSPIRVQARLTAMGMRPISNVVDATNYVMLELGQPMHPFDLDLLEDRAIVVRRAVEGERIVTLDDVERIMTADDLLIADRSKAVGIAGVIGSAVAEVHPGTSDVLLESAHFQAAGVLRTARRLRLRTEASIRFERGIDPEGPPRAADRCSRLLAEWTGGTVSKGPIDIGDPPMRRRVPVRPGRAAAVLGYEVSAPDVQEALGKLGISVEPDDDGRLVAEVPGYRVDLEQEVDLIEEVVRVQGYDRVGETLPAIQQLGGIAPAHAFRRRVRESLVRAGLREVKTFPFASGGDLRLMRHPEQAAVRVANPLDAEAAFLRTSMVPALTATLRRNLARQVRGAAIFEVGNVFWTGEDDRPVDEHEYVALAMTGPAPGRWYEPEREGDVFDAKGAVEALLADLGIEDWSVGDRPGHPMHPGRSATVLVRGETAGSVGELHPRVSAAMDLPDRVAVAELDVAVLARHAADSVQYREIPRFPPVHRDLAFVVDVDVPSATLRSALIQAAADAELGASVSLFDVFTGPPVPEGRKSLAFSVDFRAPDRTLTDEEVDRAVEAIRDRLARDVGAELRAS
jgi:phenylalanyl-tRNA synthetase beta chain